ncbi:hypothetical protein [Parasphingorhabdus sp.]|uniref:hypothetical protein n=1 Tax=Parasphingorhabdus sp. TaxID=2709688 RepID=UPI003C781642
MTTPEWLKPGIYGGIIGAVAVTIVGFSWGGWVTTGSANTMARNAGDAQVLAALVPLCVDMSKMDPNRVEKLAVLAAASSYKRRDAVMDAGWATLPGMTQPDSDLARACEAAIEASTT